MKRTQRANNGFTIVEVAVVIVILSILFTIAAISYRTVEDRNYQEELEQDLRQTAMNLTKYKAEQGEYPTPDATTSQPDLFAKSRPERTYTYAVTSTSPRLEYCASTVAEHSGISYRVGPLGVADADLREGDC